MTIRPPQPRKTERPEEHGAADARRRAETGASREPDDLRTPVATGAHSAESVEKKGCGCSGTNEDSARDMLL